MIGSNSWRALMWRNAIYRRRNIIGTVLEIALPIGFIALLVLIKSQVEETEGFAPKTIEANFPDTNDATLMFSYSDYVTALQAKRVCKKSSTGSTSLFESRFSSEFEISGMPSGGYNWQVPFLKCDRRMCTEDGEDASGFCEYSALGVAPKSASDTVGKQRTDAFFYYIQDRFPALKNGTNLPSGFNFVQVFASEQELENYVTAKDYRKATAEKPKLGLAVIWDGTDGDANSYSYQLRVNATSFNRPEDATEPGAITVPPTDQNFEHFAKDDDSCPIAPGSPQVGAQSGSCTRRYMVNGLLPTQRLIHDFIYEDTNAKDTGFFVAEHGVRFAPFPSREYVAEGFYASIAAWVPLLVTLGILYPVASMTRYIVLEKQNRQKELMKMMGIQENDIGWAWYMSFLIFHIFTAVGCGLVTKVFYAKSDVELLIIFWVLTFTSLISMCFFLASFFTKATRATLVCLMFFFGGYFITFLVDFETDASTKLMAASLHPSAAFAFGLQEIGRLEDLTIGIIWNTLNETDSASGFTFMNTLAMLVVDTLFYGMLGWYTNRVIPSEFGRPLPLHFPFTRAYWFPGSMATNTVNDEVPVDSAVHSEPVSRALKDQAKEGKSIEIRNLRKHFNEKIAVDGLNFSMYRGQCTALLGHNGAGKTTTLNMLTGMLAPTEGYAVVAGKDIRNQMIQIRQEIGICLQHDCLFDILTVKEHIQFFAMVKGLYSKSTRNEAEDKIKTSIEDVALWDKRNTYSKNLSGGMKRKLSVAIAFCGDSKTVFLDEPTSGMDPFSRRFTWNVIRQYREGRCIILTTHFMDEADILGDRIAIMADGQLRCIGSSLFLKKQYGVGYNLTVEMNGEGDNAAEIKSTINDIVTSDVGKASILTNVGAEMNFQLPIGSSSSFHSMLTRLDEEIDNGTVANYGLGITTLEEVFLLVARGDSHEKTDLTVSQRNGSGDQTPESIHDIQLQEDLFGRHVGALFRKRAANFKRDKKAWMCSTVLPSLFVLSGFLIVKYSPTVKDFQPLDLTLDTFNAKVTETPRNPITINNASVFQCQPGICAYDFASIEDDMTNESYSFCGYDINIGNNSTCSGVEKTEHLLKSLNEHGFQVVYANGESVLESSKSMVDTAEMFAASQYGGIYFTSNEDSSVQLDQQDSGSGLEDLENVLAMFGGDLGAALSQVGFEGNITEVEDLLSQARAGNTTGLVDLLSQLGIPVPPQLMSAGKGTNFGELLSQNLTYGELLETSCRQQQDDYKNRESCSLYRGLGYLIRYNFTALHAAPIFQAVADEAIIRHALNNSEFKINPSIFPLPLTKFEQDAGANADAGVPWFLIVFGFPFITGSFATFVVAERESKSKHLQTVAGVKPLAYWLSTWLWDIANYLIPMVVTIILLFAFDVEAFTTKENDVVYGVIALFILFGPAAASMTYCTTFLFKSPSVCNLVVIISNFLIGYAGAIACFVLRLIGDNPFEKNESLLNAAIITEWVLRFFPSFNLSKGLFFILFIETFHQFKGEEFNVWHKDVILYEVIFLAWQTVGYLLLAVMIDTLSSNPLAVSIWRKVFCCQCFCPSYAGRSSTDSSEEDSDVIAEQNRVLEGNTEGDTIVLKELTKTFDSGLTAVNNLSFGIPPGQCFGLLGINGAGKTTTMAMLTAEFPPSGGDAMLAGYSVMRQPEKTRRRVGYCPQFDAHFFNMTGREHIELYAAIKGVPSNKIPSVVASKLQEVGLSDDDSNKLSSKYSGGMKRRLSLACATVGQPQLLFLDECSTGVDPVARREIWQMISDMVSNQDLALEDRPSVILTTHSMEECEALCPRIAIMAAGRLKCIGSAQHLKSKFGQGYQVEMKIQNVEPKDEDFLSIVRDIASGAGVDAPSPVVADVDVDQEQALPDSVPLDEGAFLKLEKVMVALQSLTGDDFLTSKLNTNDPVGYAILKTATSEEGISVTSLAYFATAELRMKKLHSFVQEHYPQNVLREQQDTKSRYEVSSEGVKIANIFGAIEENKEELKVAEYSVSQTSLEQVFNMHAAEAAQRLQS